MDKRQEALAPFSSDECPNSGEDSDEDVITDYLGSGHAEVGLNPSMINGQSRCLNLEGTNKPRSSVDGTKENTDMMMSAEHLRDNPPLTLLSDMRHHQAHPHVPIISVTPHSPGLAKHYPVLEDNLQHLHEIHNSIQRLRDSTLSTLGEVNRGFENDNSQRLSSSCPSLCSTSVGGDVSGAGGPGGGAGDRVAASGTGAASTVAGSDPDLANCSTNSSPTHYSTIGHQLPQLLLGVDRRRSWTDLEDSRHKRRERHRCSVGNHLQAQTVRQRSISLSSLDSELDLEMDGKSRSSCAGVGNRSCRSQASTHSLNEADLVQKIAVKRANQRLGETANLLPGVAGSRLPLQKSISTPSIIGPPIQPHLADSATLTAPSLAARHERAEKGSGSETETEELLRAPHGHVFREDLIREGTANARTSLDELMNDGAVYDDSHSEKTRRKRGSLFFRKKKDKSGKKPSQQSSHHWVAITAGSQSTFLCDYCTKQLANKSVLHCENCGATVHQNQCKDHLQADCTKHKHNSNKSSTKSMSSVSMVSASGGNVKRGSTASLPLPGVIPTSRDISGKKPVTSYSPWRRVATKLGVNQTINEEKDADGAGVGHHREFSGGVAAAAAEEFDFGEDAHQLTVGDIEGLDPELGLGKEEPDSWSGAIGRSDALKLVNGCEREVKRQEHIYEFVLTEKHHCLVLLAMERIFAEGIRRHFRLAPQDLERMFPRLRDLIDIHLRFLLKLRKRQSSHSVVPTIADILVDQFSCDNATRMKSAYGEFCSRHRDAVEAYKYYLRVDPRFARFVRLCQTNPLLKKKGIPECILFVTQRLTKYPLLVEPLIKTSTTSDETTNLRRALGLVKEILGDVDACVADKEREDRKLEIYNRIDAKSFAMHRGVKFKKSDIMAINRVLKFEGTAYLMQGSRKMAPIVVVVLSDVLFFLAETRDQKYAFFVPENKAGVVSLQKLLVREKAGQESRGIYLISSNPAEPEMFELKVQKPKDKQLWIQSIRSAVEACPQDPETDSLLDNSGSDLPDTKSSSAISIISADERLRIAKAKETHILGIVGEMRKKDTEQALLLEEKISLQMRLLSAANVWNENDTETERIERMERDLSADYTRLVRNEATDSTQLWQEVVVAVQEATRLASSLSFSAGGGSLSRSLSSAGERHTDAYVPPSLCVPRRAETFAGFDHNKERYPWRDSAGLHNVMAPPNRTTDLDRQTIAEGSVGGGGNNLETDESCTEIINKDQQLAAVRLSHYVYTLLCIISNQMTTIDSLQAQLTSRKDVISVSGVGGGGTIGKSSANRPNPNRQLEELRNLQDQLSREKSAFRATSQQEKAQLQEERAQLSRLREQLAAEQRDVTQQRDQLYRRLEALERQGLSLVAPSTVGPTATSTHLNHASHLATGSTDTVQSRKSLTDGKRIPLNLISATNQQKVQSSLPPVKQQLPLKLASGSSSSAAGATTTITTTNTNNNHHNNNNNNNNNNSRSGTSTSNNSPDRHARAGSSPAAITGSAYSSPELGNNRNNGNVGQPLHPSNRTVRVARTPPEPYNQPPPPPPQQQQQQQQQQQRTDQQPQQPMEEEVIFF